METFYSYHPKVAHLNMSVNIPQMRSDALQTPFFFGGAQTPTDLFLKKSQYNGAKGSGLVSSMNRGLGHHVVQTPSGKKQIARHMPFM